MNFDNMTTDQIKALVSRAETTITKRQNSEKMKVITSRLGTINRELSSVIELLTCNPNLIHCINNQTINDFHTLLKQIIESSRLDK